MKHFQVIATTIPDPKDNAPATEDNVPMKADKETQTDFDKSLYLFAVVDVLILLTSRSYISQVPTDEITTEPPKGQTLYFLSSVNLSLQTFQLMAFCRLRKYSKLRI